MYAILSCGTNAAPNTDPLHCAEKDASDIYATFGGALGPPGVRGGALLGNLATRQNVCGALTLLGTQRPERLLLYFSGHGNEQGIVLRDGFLHYSTLQPLLRDVGARSTLVILDTCHAAAYGGFTPPGDLAGVAVTSGFDDDYYWLRALASAQPGARLLLATRAETLSYESSTGHGYFTGALLRALHLGSGDLRSGPLTFISDRQAFELACRLTARQQKKDGFAPEEIQRPQSFGRLGDFPLTRSQAERPIGEAAITALEMANRVKLLAHVSLTGRKNLPTWCRYHLSHLDHTHISSQARLILPSTESFVGAEEVGFPARVLRDDAFASTALELGDSVPVRWTVEMVDQHQRVLARRSKVMSYFSRRAALEMSW